MSLISRREGGGESDLLGLVGDEDVEVVIVDADVFIRVVRGDGGLDDGGEGGRGGEVELDDVGVLEDEARFCRPENQPDDEDDEEDDENYGNH